jgi:catechol 2,3-dioxygenase
MNHRDAVREHADFHPEDDMTTTTLPDTTSLGSVHLTVTDLDRAVDYYTTRLGFRVHAREGDEARLGAGAGDLLVLKGDPAARRVRGATGLFHFAVLVPSRADLGRAFAHLVQTRTPMTGASDHGVSEALYLDDPDGNGIEIYRDRSRAEWPVHDGRLEMVTEPMDAEGVLAARGPDAAGAYALAAGTVIGHVHLHVSRLEPAERFYRDVIGFGLMQRFGGSALFLSSGGYHHHLGLNTWAGVGAPAPPPGSVGLRHFEVRLPDRAALDELLARALAAGVPAITTPDDVHLADPSGNTLAFTLTNRRNGQ